MCGRYSFLVTDDLGRRFRVHMPTLNLRSRFNVTPGQEMPVVYEKNGYHMESMTWGLIPFWAKNPSIAHRLINARGETINTKPAFRASFYRRRCIVPASGFYEWKKESDKRIPYYYHLKGSDYFAFAGLYDIWHDPEGREVMTYTLITTEANDLVARVHDRMPVILREEDEEAWLGRDTKVPELQMMLHPSSDDRWEAYRVSLKVNNPENDEEGLIQPIRQDAPWW